MESKPKRYDELSATDTIDLLIEPVWNRNVLSSSMVCLRCLFLFNRTSMESKPATCLPDRAAFLAFNRTSMESKLTHAHRLAFL